MFQSTYKALVLQENDKFCDTTSDKATLCESPLKVWKFFTVMLVYCHIFDPQSLWEKCEDSLSEDIKQPMKGRLQRSLNM